MADGYALVCHMFLESQLEMLSVKFLVHCIESESKQNQNVLQRVHNSARSADELRLNQIVGPVSLYAEYIKTNKIFEGKEQHISLFLILM
jgi:hypothetical protein